MPNIPAGLRQTLVRDAASLASGTIASLTGFADYVHIDAIQGLFVEWCRRAPDETLVTITNWQGAWAAFWAEREQSHGAR